MKYLYLTQEHIVQEIIPEFVPIFPNIPIQKRYSAEFLEHCLPVADAMDIRLGMEYLPVENKFVWPIRLATSNPIQAIVNEPITVPVYFYSENPTRGSWKIADDSPLSGTISENSVIIPAQELGTYTLKLEYTDDFRTVCQDIFIVVINNDTIV